MPERRTGEERSREEFSLAPEYPTRRCRSRLLPSLYCLALAEGLFDVVHEDAAALQAEFAGDEPAVTVHEKRCGQHADTAVALSNRFLAEQDGVVDAHFLGEFGDVFGAGVVHGYADDLESLRAVFFLQLDKPWHLDLAWAAIGRPEVEQNGFAAKVGELEILAVERGQFEVRCQIADELSLGRTVRAIVAGRADAGEQHSRDDGGDEEQNQKISFHR